MKIEFKGPVELDISDHNANKLIKNPNIDIIKTGERLYRVNFSEYKNIEILNIEYRGAYGYATIVAYKKYNDGKMPLKFYIKTISLLNKTIDFEVIE